MLKNAGERAEEDVRSQLRVLGENGPACPERTRRIMDHAKAAVTFYQRDEIVVAGWRNIGFVSWGKQATMSSVRRMGAMSADLLKVHAKISIIQVIPDNAPLPTEDARELLLKMTWMPPVHEERTGVTVSAAELLEFMTTGVSMTQSTV